MNTNVDVDVDVKMDSAGKEVTLRVVESSSTSPLSSMPHHLHYQPFLKSLLEMSYIPCYPILHDSPKITSRRLDQEDDDYLLISRMFLSRGGIVYLKKITSWILQENGESLFKRHQPHGTSPHGTSPHGISPHGPSLHSSMRFLLN